jgi:uncharacterized protein (TIGR03435 family)
MLQKVLSDRFKLTVRHVKRELPIYNLVVSPGRPKLKESSADAKFNFVASGIGRMGVQIVATHMTLQQLVDHQLNGYVDVPIFDKTGLAAPYDLTLRFAVQDMAADNQADQSDLPALSTAIQEQLGLKFERSTALFDTIVIEHVERPSEN